MIFSFFEIKVAIAALAFRNEPTWYVRRKKTITQQDITLFNNLVANKFDVQDNVNYKDIDLTDDELCLILYSLKLCSLEIRLTKKIEGFTTRINESIGYNVEISRYHLKKLEQKLTKQLKNTNC